jgi:hypothetical protein
VGHEDSGPAATLVAAWFGLRAEDRGAAAVALQALRRRAAHIVAARCRCGIAVAEDHVADAVFVMVYGIRRAPRLRTRDDTFVEVMKLLARDGHCAPEILHALGRTPAMRARMAKVGFIPPPVSDPRRFERPSPTGAREVLAKFGVPLPKPRRPLPHTVEIGQARADARPMRLDRRGALQARLEKAGRDTRARLGSIRSGPRESL